MSKWKREVLPDVRSKIIDRDGGLCILCGKQGGQIHHARYGSQLKNIKQELRNTKYNLVFLCPACHTKIHTHGHIGYRLHCIQYLSRIYPGIEILEDSKV